MIDPLIPAAREYLGQESVQVRVAPVRRAFLVKTGNEEQLKVAMQAAAALWGGARCLILPVDLDGSVAPLWLQLAGVTNVSVIVDFTDRENEGSARIRGIDQWNVVPARPLSDARFWNLHPVAAPRDPWLPSEVYLATDPTLLNLAGAGGYGLAEEIDIFQSNGYTIANGTDSRGLALAQIAGSTALGATLHGDSDTYVGGGMMRTAGLLWLADEAHPWQDAVSFWNARAVRPRLGSDSIVNVLTTRSVARDSDFARAFNERVTQTSTCDPAFFILSDTLSADECVAVGEAIGGALYHGAQLREKLAAVPERVGPLEFLVNQSPWRFWIGSRKSGHLTAETVQLRRPSSTLTVDSPLKWPTPFVMSGRVNLTLTSPSISGPARPQVASLYHQNADWSGNDLRIRTDNLPQYSLEVGLPTPQAILRAAVSASGFEYRRSDKGQHVAGMCTRGGDLQLFRHPATVAVIQRLTAKPGRDLARELKRIRQADAVTSASLDALRNASLLGRRPALTVNQLRDAPNHQQSDILTVVQVIDELLDRQIVEMGMTVSCPLCSLTEFQLLRDLSGSARCEGCGSRAEYERDSSSYSPLMQFRLTSLAHTLSLNGGLVPLAATALLAKERAFVEPGVNIFDRTGSPAGEVDLLGWTGQKLFAGEAKSSIVGFDNANIEADVIKAASLGADEFVAVCLTDISMAAIERMQLACKSSGVALRIIEGSELLSTDVI